MSLARKQRTRHEDWLPAVRAAYDQPDIARADRLIDHAAGRLCAMLDSVGATSAVYSWSGGKDSQVTHLVCQAAGYADRGVIVLTDGLEYPEFETWVGIHAPLTIEIERRPQDLAWLAKHPCWLFPETAAAAGRWFAAVQHAGQRKMMRRTGADALVMGRRIADGNYCGESGLYRDGAVGRAHGFWRASPIFDWSHEDVLCVLGAHQVDMAPCYGWPEGFRVATGPWAKRRRHRDGLAATWRLVHQIDPSVVAAAAAAGIDGAAQVLDTPATEAR